MNNRVAVVIAKLAAVIFHNRKNAEIFDKLRQRCLVLTSDDGISISLETYRDPSFHLGVYYRFVIEGTRCSQNITFDSSYKVIRKPVGSKPIAVETFDNRNCYEVTDLIEKFVK